MELSNFGICLEIIGFVLLSLTAGRNTKESTIAYEDHDEDLLTKIRNRLVPNKIVIPIFLFGFGFIVAGLLLQLK